LKDWCGGCGAQIGAHFQPIHADNCLAENRVQEAGDQLPFYQWGHAHEEACTSH